MRNKKHHATNQGIGKIGRYAKLMGLVWRRGSWTRITRLHGRAVDIKDI